MTTPETINRTRRLIGARVTVQIFWRDWLWFMPSRYNHAIGLGLIVLRYEPEYTW